MGGWLSGLITQQDGTRLSHKQFVYPLHYIFVYPLVYEALHGVLLVVNPQTGVRMPLDLPLQPRDPEDVFFGRSLRVALNGIQTCSIIFK